MTYAIAGNELGDIQTLHHGKRTKLTIMPMPLGDSDATESFDAEGVIRSIKITGEYAETSPDPQTWAATMQGLIDGDQKKSEGDYGYIYHDDFLNIDVNVKIELFDFDYDAGNPDEIKYTLELVETTNTT